MVKEEYNYLIITLKNKKVVTPVCDIINSNRICERPTASEIKVRLFYSVYGK